MINQELLKYAEYNRNCYFVTGEKLYPNPDGIHINAESQRILAIGGSKLLQTKSNVVEPLDNEANMVKELCEREYTQQKKIHNTRTIYIRKKFHGRSVEIFKVET